MKSSPCSKLFQNSEEALVFRKQKCTKLIKTRTAKLALQRTQLFNTCILSSLWLKTWSSLTLLPNYCSFIGLPAYKRLVKKKEKKPKLDHAATDQQRRKIPESMTGWLVFQGFPGGTVGKNLPVNAGDTGSMPESGRSPGAENGNPPQYLAGSILWTEGPGVLPSLWSHRAGHD